MSKRILRWLLPLLIIVAIAVAFVVTPILSSHAATTTPNGVATPSTSWPAK